MNSISGRRVKEHRRLAVERNSGFGFRADLEILAHFDHDGFVLMPERDQCLVAGHFKSIDLGVKAAFAYVGNSAVFGAEPQRRIRSICNTFSRELSLIHI